MIHQSTETHEVSPRQMPLPQTENTENKAQIWRFGQSDLCSVECAANFLVIEKEHAMRAHSSVDGPIAQSVEQLAFNQWVAGSSPARLISLTIV